MTNDLLLHPSTKKALETALDHQPHALMLIGPLGSGKLTVAQAYASQLLGLPDMEALSKYPYYRHFSSDGAVSIEQIRTIQSFLQLRTTGKGSIRRLIIIEDAHTMTVEAQNALLKVLEEPPADTCLILTVQGEHSLKPTIYSRVQRITIKPVRLASTISYYTAQNHTESEIKKAYLMADGGVGLISLLLSGDADNPLQAHIDLAKRLLTSSAYERLLYADELSKAKEGIPGLLYAIKRVSMSALEAAAIKGQEGQIKRWHQVLRAVYESESSLSANPNMKLMLTNLFLHL